MVGFGDAVGRSLQYLLTRACQQHSKPVVLTTMKSGEERPQQKSTASSETITFSACHSRLQRDAGPSEWSAPLARQRRQLGFRIAEVAARCVEREQLVGARCSVVLCKLSRCKEDIDSSDVSATSKTSCSKPSALAHQSPLAPPAWLWRR